MDHRQPAFDIPPSKFIRIDVLDLFRLDTEIFKRLPLRAVVETDHQLRQAGPEYYPLDLLEGLPERMSPEIALEVDRSARVRKQKQREAA